MPDQVHDLALVTRKVRDGRRLSEAEREWVADVLERVRAAHTVTTEDIEYTQDRTGAAFFRSGVLAHVLIPMTGAPTAP